MLRITKQSDYAVVLMTHIVSTEDRWLNASELAARAGLPQPIVSKILKLLTRGRLLESHRGVKGGYCLARPSAEITVAEIIEALEGPISVTECIEESPGECSQEAFCRVRGNWQRINHVLRDALSEITLEEMARPGSAVLVTLGDRETVPNVTAG
ncbi:MAG: SUF system Fe-S cluster assembly regulator [Nitrospirae bacterium]|nr:SUF system Fe-S cluster assembly regulator [Nitrospirota bacterium]